MTEWPNVLVLKTSVAKATVGSNPTLSAILLGCGVIGNTVGFGPAIYGSNPYTPGNLLKSYVQDKKRSYNLFIIGSSLEPSFFKNLYDPCSRVDNKLR